MSIHKHSEETRKRIKANSEAAKRRLARLNEEYQVRDLTARIPKPAAPVPKQAASAALLHSDSGFVPVPHDRRPHRALRNSRDEALFRSVLQCPRYRRGRQSRHTMTSLRRRELLVLAESAQHARVHKTYRARGAGNCGWRAHR